jgi:hypothetical protein
VEIRLRCLEASTRIAGAELPNGAVSNVVAEDVMQMADVYFAYVKGISLRTNLRRVLEQRKPVAVSQLQTADEAQLPEPANEVQRFR